MGGKSKNRCARCGKRIRKGGIFYRLKAELISGFDGQIFVDEKLDLEAFVEKVRERLDDLSSEEIEQQVYKKHEYVTCSECRDEIDNFLESKDNK